MIVSEKNVSDALAYLAADPHPVAVARHNLTKCENATKLAYAAELLDAEGTTDARKAVAESSFDHVKAKGAEADAVLEFERHRARVKAAEMLIEVWRSENANIRAAEKIR